MTADGLRHPDTCHDACAKHHSRPFLRTRDNRTSLHVERMDTWLSEGEGKISRRDDDVRVRFPRNGCLRLSFPETSDDIPALPSTVLNGLETRAICRLKHRLARQDTQHAIWPTRRGNPLPSHLKSFYTRGGQHDWELKLGLDACAQKETCRRLRYSDLVSTATSEAPSSHQEHRTKQAISRNTTNSREGPRTCEFAHIEHTGGKIVATA